MLTTVESLRQYLAKDDADVQDDDLLFEIIKRKSVEVNNNCNRTLEATDYVEYYKGDGTNKLLLNQYPVNSIASIYDDVSRVFGASTLKDPTTYVVATQVPNMVQLIGDIFINSEWNSYFNIENIKISYNAGYASIPYDIEGAVNKLCAVEYFKSKGMMAGVKSDRDPKSLEQEAWDALAQYRKIR